MTSVSGLLRVGEASPAVRTISARQHGSRFYYFAILFGLLIAGGVCGGLFSFYALHDDPSGGMIPGIVVGGVIFLLIANRLSVARFRSKMAKKGYPDHLQLEMEVTPGALLYRIGDVRHIAAWSAVSEVFESRGYWIFLAQSSPFFAPKRFFQDAAAEKAFIAAALEHMSADARARSREAAGFAGVSL